MAIVKQYKVTISKDAQATTDYIYVYQHDRGVDLQFSIIDMRELGNGFRGDILKGLSDMYSTITIVKPDSSSFKSEKLPIVSGKVLFTITEELTDELAEIGMYTLQIHLHDIQDNRITIPEVQFEVKELISDLDCENTGAVAGYSRVGMTEVASEQVLFTFTRGYSKTTWATGDKITAVKLNNLETGLETVTAEVEQLKASGGGTGTQGPKGDKGDTGATPNVQIGTVTTLAPGQNATVSKRGTIEVPIFDFGIPKGEKGADGAGGSGGTDPDPNSHTHANKTVLDGITEQKVAEWDTNGNGGTNVQLNSVTQSTFNFKEENGVFTVASVGDKNISFPVREGNLVMRDIIDGEIFEIGDIIPPPVIVYGNIVLSTSSLSVNEKATNTFTVKLDKAPNNNQLVSLSVNNAYCTLNKTSLTFTPSDYATPQTVTITGVHDTIHYSNKNSIVTVSSQKVTSKTVAVTIVNIDEQPSETIAVTSISLNKNTATIKVDGTVQLVAAIQPPNATNKNVIWSANNANVEVTQQGLVTGKVMGNSIVTITTEDGSKTATCNIIIESKGEPIPPSEELNPTYKDGLIHMYNFGKYTSESQIIIDEIGTLNFTPVCKKVNNAIKLINELSINNIWNKGKEHVIFLTCGIDKTNSSFIYLGDNIIKLRGNYNLETYKGSVLVGSDKSVSHTIETLSTLAFCINPLTKEHKLYIDGELKLQGNYTSDWSEDRAIFYTGVLLNNLLIYEGIPNDSIIKQTSKEIQSILNIKGISIPDISHYYDFKNASEDGISPIYSIDNMSSLTCGKGTYTKVADGVTINTSDNAHLISNSKFGIYANHFSLGLRIKIDPNESGNEKLEIMGTIKITANIDNIFVKVGTLTTTKFTNVIANTFYNIFITIDANNTLKFYVNGNLIGELTSIVYQQNVLPYMFCNNNIYNKIISYNRTLTNAEIMTLSNEMEVI